MTDPSPDNRKGLIMRYHSHPGAAYTLNRRSFLATIGATYSVLAGPLPV